MRDVSPNMSRWELLKTCFQQQIDGVASFWPTQVELYLDLSCSDCAIAWPAIVQAAKEFGRGAEFIFRLFPLPYHSNAFTAAKVYT